VYDWWRSDWNPVSWDAEEWFKTHEQAPWVEHTLALIEEGWETLFMDPEPLRPRRVRAPPPAPLNMWEIYVRKQVDKRVAAQAAASQAKWASVGEYRDHCQDNDVRFLASKATFPNYRPIDEWSLEEIQALIACPPNAWQALSVYDPEFPSTYRGLRPVGPNELDALRATGRLRENGPSRRAASEVTVAQLLGEAPMPEPKEPGQAQRVEEWLEEESESDVLAEATDGELEKVRDVGDDW